MDWEYDAATHWYVLQYEYDRAVQAHESVLVLNYLAGRLQQIAKESE